MLPSVCCLQCQIPKTKPLNPVPQALMDIESANHLMFPFFSPTVLEQRSPHTRVVRGWFHSRGGWLTALCAPREVRRCHPEKTSNSFVSSSRRADGASGRTGRRHRTLRRLI